MASLNKTNFTLLNHFKLHVDYLFTNFRSTTFYYSTLISYVKQYNYCVVLYFYRKKMKWDIFKESSNETASVSEKQKWRTAYILLTVALCFFFFIVVMATATLSKLTFLLLTFNIFPRNNFTLRHNSTIYYLKGPSHVVEVKWIWALLMVICAPYFFTACSCLWRLIFKKTGELKFVPLLMVSAVWV